jgi:nitrogen fixation/metabolism regulation signal transduction histidine kinase
VRQKRKKIWIDHFQTRLSRRLALYFILYQLAVWSLFGITARITAMAESAGWSLSVYGYFLTPVMTLGLGILFICDVVRLTHRVVGPLYRFRQTVQAVTAGEEVRLVVLRKGDHLQELKDDFNAMLRALEQRGAITLVEAGDRQPVGV